MRACCSRCGRHRRRAALLQGALGSEVRVIPTPQYLETLNDSIRVPDGGVVGIVPGPASSASSPKMKLAASFLEDSLRRISASTKVMIADQKSAGVAIHLWNWAVDPNPPVPLNLLDWQTLSDPNHWGQSYVIRAPDATSLWAIGGSDQGVLLAAMTILQIMRRSTSGIEIPGVYVRDSLPEAPTTSSPIITSPAISYVEPMEIINAEYDWNVHSNGFYRDPRTNAEAIETWRRFMLDEDEPRELLAPGGLFPIACNLLYGSTAGPVMAAYYRTSQFIPDGAPTRDSPDRRSSQYTFLPMTWNRAYPTPSHWRHLGLDSKTWGTEITNEAYVRAMEGLKINREELHRRLARRWGIVAELNRKGGVFVDRALASEPLPEAVEDLRFLQTSFRVYQSIRWARRSDRCGNMRGAWSNSWKRGSPRAGSKASSKECQCPGGTLKASVPGIGRKPAYTNGPDGKCHTAWAPVGSGRPLTTSHPKTGVLHRARARCLGSSGS